MSTYASQFETLIQLSGTFVALISGFAVSRYFSNFAEIQKLSYERRLIAPKIESLGDLIAIQKEIREGDETTRIIRELNDLFDQNDNRNKEELLEIIDSDFSKDEVEALIDEYRNERNFIDQILPKKLGSVIPVPSEETLNSIEIPFTEKNLPIYLDALRRYRDRKRSELGIANPFHLNLSNFDALTRHSMSLIPLGNSNLRKRTESENVELFLDLEHKDTLLQAEILSREIGMKLKNFVFSTLLTSLFGILFPVIILVFPEKFDTFFCQIFLMVSTSVTICSSYFYVVIAVRSTKIVRDNKY
jgi:hypothetical protein